MQSEMASDLIWGVADIAEAIGRDERATYHLLSKGALPAARKVGGRWVIARHKLWEIFNGSQTDASAKN